MKTYFISDLHLSDDTPTINHAFFHFIDNKIIQDASNIDALYILGDFFEVWVGDDYQTALTKKIAQTLKQVTTLGIPVYFICGNRDFLLGKHYAKIAHLTLLPEQTVIDLYGTPTLLCHGDELCTDDIDYQKFRKKSRGWWWPKLMLALPLWYRQRVAANIRAKSKDAQQHKPLDIMDVTQHAVLEAFEQHQVSRMIHGHTHRPNTHHYSVNGQQLTRIVLGDWYNQGSYLLAEKHGCSLISEPFST